MMHISSSEFKRQLGSYLATARETPLRIERGGQPMAIVLSPDEYEYLQELEDQYWIARADAALKSGDWVSHEEAIQQLAGRLSEAE